MAKKDNEVHEDQELLKALKDLGINDISEEDIVKSEDEDTKGKEGEEDDDAEEDVEKAYGSKKAEYEDMQKACDLKKGELEKMEAEIAKKKEVKKSEEEDISKSTEDDITKSEEVKKEESSDLIKSLTETLSGIQSSLETQSETSNELQKSLTELREENDELKKSIDEIGSQRPGMKSMNSVHFIEKGEKVNDDEGRNVLSATKDKEAVQSILSKAMEEEEDSTIQKSLSDNLLSYNMGGAAISEATANYLFKNKNVRLVK